MATSTIDGAKVLIAERSESRGLASRIAFRFCFIYFGLYCLGTQIFTLLAPIPRVDIPDLATFWPMRPLVMRCAAHWFHVPPPSFEDTGSGDRMFDWVLVFCLLVIAPAATAVWSIVDRKRVSYATLAKWFRVFIRISLAGQMMSYGLAKAVPVQMPFPRFTQLLEPFGHMSPMNVLWSSIGSAPAYEMFAGCAELLGGILLIFPRTTTLGAMVCLADMIEVFVLNMTYDVPVKLLSFHLILLSLFLLAPECSRLIRFFVLNRTVEPSTLPELFSTPRRNRIALIAQVAFGAWLFGMNAYGGWVNWHEYGGGRAKSELYGVWEVDQYAVDGEVRPQLITDKESWHLAIFDSPQYAIFRHPDESNISYFAAFDTKDSTLTLSKRTDKTWHATLAYQRTADHMTMDGSIDRHKLHVELHAMDMSKFLVSSHGFHWVSERPFDR